jgi:hypothetical protein
VSIGWIRPRLYIRGASSVQEFTRSTWNPACIFVIASLSAPNVADLIFRSWFAFSNGPRTPGVSPSS